ncbi:MAG: sugar transferase [Candidatus Aminicenantes bacterium]|nr:sugar transferase [Candidatus Aminicenantes bacterium]
MKRLFDLLFSFIGLLLLQPFFIVIAIMIKVDSIGPVFFRQGRVGKNFRRFMIYKFRTMVVDAEKKGLRITSGGDRRVTRVGRMLRKFKIDELPQLFNVLKGDMSLVGPRPEVEEYVKLYEEDYREILKRRPGITDVSSIIFREEEAVLENQADPEGYYKKILLPEKIRLTKEYIEKSSFLYDLKLVLNTLHRIFYPPDVSRDGYRQKIIQDSSKEN